MLAFLLIGPAGAVNVNRLAMMSSDPNRNPSWDWTVNTTYTLYVSSLASPVNVLLPYYSALGPAAGDLNIAGDRDILPSQGWVLVVRDFGSSFSPTPLPYFILYNKYRGLLRLFKTDPTLVFDITGVNTTNLVASGTIDLNQILEVNQPNSANGFQHILNGAVTAFTRRRIPLER